MAKGTSAYRRILIDRRTLFYEEEVEKWEVIKEANIFICFYRGHFTTFYHSSLFIRAVLQLNPRSRERGKIFLFILEFLVDSKIFGANGVFNIKYLANKKIMEKKTYIPHDLF